MKRSKTKGAKIWERYDAEWRDPAQIISLWEGATELDPQLLRYKVHGGWWETIAASGITLLVTREYEHMLMALGVKNDRPLVSYMRVPHPSGLAVDRKRGTVHLASTRNPNQILDLKPVDKLLDRLDVSVERVTERPLVPVRSRFLPGSLYLHELAIIGGKLYGNAVGENSVVRLSHDGGYDRVWWPSSIEPSTGPIFGRNHLQFNSIAAGKGLKTSYFSASTDKPSTRRPGDKNFPVDKRGVIFSGATRQPVAYGLTRPHSARLHDGLIWVDNSGYGEFGFIERGGFTSLVRLPGWTRGLCFYGNTAFVGVSRVIPRFRHYAPGLSVDKSSCGVYAVDTRSGKVLGSLTWPGGNQIFAVEWVESSFASGLPFALGANHSLARTQKLFYCFQTRT